MVPFDVLSLGNISDFHLEPSNLHFFHFFKFQSPFKGQKKNSSDYRDHGTQNDRLESRVSMQKYAPSPEILAKRSQNMQVWFGNPDFGTF